MVTVDAITPADVGRWKTLRLRALLDSPRAFGSTYADVSRWSNADWDRRVAQLCGDRQVGFLARDGADDVGMVGGVLSDEDRSRAAVVSMWVAPSHRGRGVGRLLVSRVAEWAQSKRCDALVLSVTSSNDAAVRFYDRLGFARTGRTEPYPNEPGLSEVEMVRPTLRMAVRPTRPACGPATRGVPN